MVKFMASIPDPRPQTLLPARERLRQEPTQKSRDNLVGVARPLASVEFPFVAMSREVPFLFAQDAESRQHVLEIRGYRAKRAPKLRRSATVPEAEKDEKPDDCRNVQSERRFPVRHPVGEMVGDDACYEGFRGVFEQGAESCSDGGVYCRCHLIPQNPR